MSTRAALLLVLGLAIHQTSAQVLDDSCLVTVNGQTVQVNPDGTFVISNISAADLFGAGGPGTGPDFLSDDFLQLTGMCISDGQPVYVTSDCFQITRNESFNVGELVFSNTPPILIVSLFAEPEAPTLAALGETTTILLTATAADGNTGPIDPSDGCRTTFRTSNPAIVQVDENGTATAAGPGSVLITATNGGATSVTPLLVSLGDPLTAVTGIVVTEDGIPVADADITLEGITGTGVSDANGSFVIAGVATLAGDIIAKAAATVGGVQLHGASDASAPVGGAFTDVGFIVASNRSTWISPVSGSWHTASNWEGGFIPGTGNVAVIDVPDADITVTYSTGTTNLAALECSESFTLGAGTFSIDETSFIDKTFTHQNGSATLTGSGDLTISTSMLWTSGTMSGTGTITIAPGATWSGFGTTLARAMVNHGTGSLPGSSTTFQDGTLTNATDGLLTFPGTGVTFTNGSGTNAIINEGIFNQSSTGTTTLFVPFTSTGTVNVNQGTLSLNNAGTISGSIHVASGATLKFGGFPAPTHTLDASSSLDSDGTVAFEAGTINVLGSYDSASTTTSASVNFDTGQTITFPTLTMGGGVLSGGDDFLVTGLFSLAGGTMSGTGTMTIASGATWSLGGGSTLARTFVNHGSGTPTGSTTFQGITLTNAVDGLITASADGGMAFTNGAGTNTFINEGIFNQSSAVSASIGVPFTSTGTVNVNQSTLSLSNTSTISGLVTVAPGANLAYTNGSVVHTLDATSVVDSAGTVTFEFGTINVLGSYDSPITNLSLGPVVNFNTGQTITCPTLTVNGVLSGGDDISVTGSLTWGGTMAGTGTTTLEAGSINSAPGNTTFQRLVVNHGTFTISAAPIFNNGTLINAVDGELTSTNSPTFTNGGGTNALINEGIFNHSGTGTTLLLIPFTSSGTTNVNQGGLTLREASTHSASLNVATGATVTFDGSVTHTLEASSSLDSDGTVIFGAGTINVLGSYDSPVTSLPFSGVVNFNTGQTITFPILTMSAQFGAALSGGDDISVTGSLTWSNGTMSGTGTTTLEAGSTNTGPGSGGTFILQRPLINHGTFTTSGNATFNNGTLTNASDGVLTSNPSFGQNWTTGGGANAFINEGIFNQSGTGTTSVFIPFTNNGTANIVSSGLSLSGAGSANNGIMAVSTGATLSLLTPFTNAQAAELRGTGTLNTISGTLTQAGAVAPGLSPGPLTVTGNLPNTSTAVTNIEIGGLAQGTEYDSLSISGIATLDGTLNITLINGFQPQLGDTFTIMTYGSFTGAFDTIVGADLGGGLEFDVVVNTTSITLEVIPATGFHRPRATHR